MAKIVKTLTVSWQWSGDKYSLRGFNLAVTPAAKNPKEEVVATAFVETKEIKQTYSYKMGNVTLDKDAQYKIWVQAVYENSDSDWVATGGATVSDDGSATIITKTDREIQDIVNMASDNILTRQEKISLRREWQEIVYEFLEIESTAVAQGIPSSNTAFSNFKSKGNALGTYLNGGTAWTISSSNKTSFPLWINDSNLGNNTSINGNTYRETFRVYYEAKVKILEEINKYKVNSVQVGGVNLLVGTATAKNTNVNVPTGYVTWDPYTTHNKQTLEQLGFKVGDKVTVGFDWSISKNGTNDYVYGNFRVEFRGIKSDGTDNQYLGVIKNPAGTFSSSNTKGRVEATVALDSTTIKAHSLRFRIDNSVLNFKVSNLKMERGTKATGWSPALEEMENAYTVILTNEAQVIPTNSNRVPTSSTTYFTDIQVYKGTTQRNDYAIGTINSANGITVSKTSSRVNFAVSTNTALAADGGNFIIPITIDGKTFNKTFSWSCSKQGNTGATGATGPAGQDAQHVVVTGEQVFKYANNFSGEPTPATITLTATKINTTATGKWQWLNGSTWTDWTSNASTLNATTLSVSPTSGSLNTGKSIRIRYIVGSVYDEITLVKVSDGAKGENGEAGKDAYTVILTNETHTFPAQNNGNIPTALSTTTQVVAYKGASSITPTIGNLPSVSGLTLSKSGTTVTVQANTGTSLADSGSFNIPVTVDGKSFTKTFSWSKAKQGNTGATGNAGQDAITIVLSNENHTFPCESNGNIPTALSTTCVVTAYKGGTSVTPTIGAITNPTGMTITKNGATLTIQANTGTSLADSGTVNIPISVDGKTFNKTFTWSKAKKGATGATGAGAKTVDIIASSQVFKSTDGGLTFSPATIKLTPKLQNVTYSNWQYSTNGGSSWTNVVSGEKGLSIDSSNKALTVSKDSSLFTPTVTSVAFRLNTNDSSVYDTMTIVKLYDIADLEIGGRNYLQNSNFANGLDKWTVHDMSNNTGTNKSVSTIKGGSWADPNINTLQIKGTNVTGRYGVISSNITLVANTTYTISGYCAGHRVRKIQINVRDKQNSDANIHTVEYNPVNGGNSLSKYYKFETTFTTTSNTLFALNLYAVDLADNGYVWFANVKLEKGNRASDWTPAPEDVATDIDNAKTEAIDSANNTLTTTISNYYTKEETNSQIDIAKEAIILGVSSTYETKENVETKVSNVSNTLTSKIDGIQVGGRNLIRKADLGQNNSTATYDGATNTWTVNATAGAGGTWGCGLVVKNKNALVPYGKSYVLSFEIKVPKACSWNFDINNYALTGSSWAGNDNDNTSKRTASSKSLVANQWIKCWIKWENTNSNNTNKVDIYDNSNFGVVMKDETSNMTYQIRNVKGELGNMPTEWTPAPEDVDSAINKKANSADVYKKTEVYTIEETNSQIEIAKDAINLGVSSTYETKENVETKVSNVSNTLTSKIDGIQVGGRNLFLNSGFTKGLNYWHSHNCSNPQAVADSSALSGYAVKFTSTGGGIYQRKGGASSNATNYSNGSVMTVSGYVKSSVANKVLRPSFESAGGNNSKNITCANANTWYYFTHTHKIATNNFSTVTFYGDSGADYYLKDVMLEYGNKASTWTPAPEDVSKDITDVKNSLNSFQNTVNTTFKDGIIEEAEAKAIAQHLKTLDVEKADIDKEYSAIYENSLLGGAAKTNLANAKTSFDSAHNSLKSTINTVISDGKVTSTEKASVDSTFTTYNSVLGTYKQRVQEALDAISSAKVDNVKIGGRNLMPNTNFHDGTRGWGVWNGANSMSIVSGRSSSMKALQLVLANQNGSGYSTPLVSCEGGKSYTVSFWFKSTIACKVGDLLKFRNANGNESNPISAIYISVPANTWTYYSRTFTVPTSTVSMYTTPRIESAVGTPTVQLTEYQLEEGTKATSWTPSPEDVQALIGTKANSVDVYTKAEVYTKSQTDSQINVAKDAINLGVSQTYETKANVETKINNIAIGGTNLIANSNFAKNAYWATNSATAYNNNGYNGNRCITITRSGYTDSSRVGTSSSTNSINDVIPKGTIFTLSGWVYVHSGSGIPTLDADNSSFFLRCYKVTDNALVDVINIPIPRTTEVNKWIYFSKSGTTSENYKARPSVSFYLGKNGKISLSQVKLEYGNKATSWTPAPEDMETTVSAIEQRVSAAEQKITDTAITNTVKKNFYTKTETDSAITSKGYQTSSQVQQTVDNLQIKFTESGGYNLLKNGKAALNTNFWISNGGGISRDADSVYKTCFKTSLPSGIKYNGGDNGGAIRLKNNTHYVYEALVFSRTAIPGSATTPLHFWCGATATTGNYNQCTIVDYQQAVPKINTWTKCYVHILTKASGEVWFTPYIYTGGNLTGDIWVTEISLSESSIQTPYSPHPSEIYDGITTIDKNGINVSTSYGAHTQFHSGGMSSYNNSNQRTLGIENGGISFHAWNNNALAAYVTQSSLWEGNKSANGLAISTTANGTYVALGTSSLSDVNTTLNMDQALTISSADSFQPRGINFWKDVHAHGYGIRQLSHLKLAGSGAIQFDYLNNSPSTIYEAVDSGHSLYLMGGYQMHLGVMEGSGTPHGVIWMKGKTDTHSYTHWNFHNYTMYNMKTASTYANIESRKLTESYGVTSNVDGIRYLYRDVELINGKAIRSIPLAYSGATYDIVSIVCKGRGSAWVEKEDKNRFEISGDCKSVNVEIIIYPSEAVMTTSTQQLEEAPTLELPKKIEPEEALQITNETAYNTSYLPCLKINN